MEEIRERALYAAFFCLVGGCVCLFAGFFEPICFIPAGALFLLYAVIDKKQLRCPCCCAFTNLDRLLYARRHEYHCACCVKRLRVGSGKVGEGKMRKR